MITLLERHKENEKQRFCVYVKTPEITCRGTSEEMKTCNSAYRNMNWDQT